MSSSWATWYALLVLLPVSILALILKPARVARWFRLATGAMILAALGAWLGHIFARTYHHDRPLVVSSAGFLSDTLRADAVALATYSIALIKDTKCAGGVIPPPVWRKLPAGFIATPTGDSDAALLWLSNALCRKATVSDEVAIFDLQPAQGITLAWVHEWPVAAPSLLQGRWAGSRPPAAGTPPATSR